MKVVGHITELNEGAANGTLRIEGTRVGPVHSCGWSEERRAELTAVFLPNEVLC